MKKLILIFLAASNTVFAQYNKSDIMERVSMKGPVLLPDSVQLQVYVSSIMQLYGAAFKCYQEFKSGSYRFEMKDAKTGDYAIVITNEGKEIYRIAVKRRKIETGEYVLSIDAKEINKLVDDDKFASYHRPQLGLISIIERNGILYDQRILPIDDLEPDEQRILDRTFTTTHFDDQFGNELELYKICQSGCLIPYGGGHSKVLTIDNGYHSIIYFDQGQSWDTVTSINRTYGYYGDDDGEFMNPTGICLGRKSISGNDEITQVFIADMYNLRIAKVNYVADLNFNKYGRIDGKSFKSLGIITFPYDISYFKTQGDSVLDKIWVSQAFPPQPFLTCINLGGVEVQSFVGYNYNGQDFLFGQGTLSRLDIYNESFKVLCFVDNIRNYLVVCPLNGEGIAMDSITTDGKHLIAATDVVVFPEDYRINSVHIHKTSFQTIQWPYVWVTSGYSPPFKNSLSYVHLFKMNKTPHLAYLASTKLPTNSLEPFGNLMNTMSVNEYYDLYTIEKWDNEHGLRKYYPSADIHSNSLESYCGDSIDVMKWKAVLTNDCWLKMSAMRLAGNNWVPVKIKKLNGQTVNDWTVIKYQEAGWNQSDAGRFVDLQLDLPLEDYALGGKVQINVKIFPEYYPECNDRQYHINVKDAASVTRFCLPRPGGCPFVYVMDQDSVYKIDNNILHRSEFPEYSGTDIKDLYKLRVEPGIIDNRITISIVENESDHSKFDRIKLYAVDYDQSKILGVTEGNQPVVYEPIKVISTDTAYLNGTKIHQLIQYNNPQGVKAFINDSIYAHYPLPTSEHTRFRKRIARQKDVTKSKKLKTQSRDEKSPDKPDGSDKSNNLDFAPGVNVNSLSPALTDSVALIALIQNLDTLIPVSAKYWAGNLSAISYLGSIKETKFARREYLSEAIIPLFGSIPIIGDDYIQRINFRLQSDAKINYLAAVKISYSLLPIEITLEKASLITRSTTTDILTNLQNADSSYAEMDSTAMITLKFNTSNLPPPLPGHGRAYLIETIGHYTTNNSPGIDPKNIINNIPLKNQLYHNFPNPFNPLTKIKFDISKDNYVKIILYNILGQEIKKLVNEFRKAGKYVIEFDGTNFASGVYFYRIESGDFVDAKKMVLLK